MQTGLHCKPVYIMNHIGSLDDPFKEGAIRMVRAHSRDGLSELGQAAVMASAATLAALKLWRPDLFLAAGIPLMAILFALSFLVRHATDRLRRRIGPPRAGYAGHGSLRPAHLLSVLAPCLSILLLGWFGLRSPGLALVVLAIFLGGVEILKGVYARVNRMVAIGAFSILLAAGLALTGWSFMACMAAWAAVGSTINLAIGSWTLWSYLR